MAGSAAVKIAPSAAPKGTPAGKGNAAKGTGSGGNRNSPYSSPLYNPSQTLTGKPLAQAAGQIADAQTQAPLSELASQMARNNRQGTAAQGRTFSYYMQLAQDAKDSLGQEQAINSSLSSQLAGISQGTGQQIAQYGQQATSGALGRLGALGLDGGQLGQLQAETAREQGVGALQAGTFQAAGANQGANYAANAASSLGTNALRGQERLADMAQGTALENAPLADKQASLIASRGALTATALGQLRSQERNYQIAQEGLGVKQSAINSENTRSANTISGENARSANSIAAANQRSANAIAAEGARSAATIAGEASRNNAAIAARHSAAIIAAGGKTALSTHEQNALYNEIDRLPNLIKSMRAAVVTPTQSAALAKEGVTAAVGSRLSGQQIRTALNSQYPSPQYVTAGYELLGYGHITPQTAAYLHSAGLRGSHYKVAAPPPTPNNPALRGFAF